jgi:hypothetical protein
MGHITAETVRAAILTEKAKATTARPGPSNLYLRLLRGEISPKEYADKVRRNVDRRIGKTRAAS